MSVKAWLKSFVGKSMTFEPYFDHSLTDALKVSSFNGGFQDEKFRQGYDKWRKNFVLAHMNEIWTYAHLGFHVISSDLIPHLRFENHFKTKSVPDDIFNAWVEYVENFARVQEFDEDDLPSGCRMKIVIKNFKIVRRDEFILLKEVPYSDCSVSENVKIKRGEFFNVLEDLTCQFFNEDDLDEDNVNVTYNGNFDLGWALGRRTKFYKREYKNTKTRLGVVSGVFDSALPVTLQEFENAWETTRKD